MAIIKAEINLNDNDIADCITEKIKQNLSSEDSLRISDRGRPKSIQEMSETVSKLKTDAIINLLRELLLAAWDYNNTPRKQIGGEVIDALIYLMKAMERAKDQEDDKS